MISYAIEPHEITTLTAPMWDACGLECPAMIGAPCPKDANPWAHCTLPKFTSAAAEVIYSWTLDSGQSEECGNSVDGNAWNALFRNPDAATHDGPMGAGVILTETSGGFVTASRYATTDELEADWSQCLTDAGEPENPCNCEHESHFPEDGGTEHAHMAVPAGDRSAQHVGPVCDECADGHIAEYLV